MFKLSPFKHLKKELAGLYKQKHKLESEDTKNAAVVKELDQVITEIDELIEGRYSKEVFQYYAKIQPALIRIRTGEEVTWKEAFGDSYDVITKSQKHSLVGIVEGTGRYKLK